MMMQMLEAGGITILTDSVREADQSNPRGYYEHEMVKSLPRGNSSFLQNAQGKAVKVVSNLLNHLPTEHRYKIILMRRNIDSILSSQRTMLGNLDVELDHTDDGHLRNKYEKHIKSVVKWAPKQSHFELLEMEYETILDQPEQQINAIQQFLDQRLDTKAMLSTIDLKLQHHSD